MRIYCRECGAKSAISKTVRHSVDAVDIYCVCGDLKCSHRFVWTAGFKHSISTTNKEKSEVIKMLLETMQTDEKRDLIHKLQIEVV